MQKIILIIIFVFCSGCCNDLLPAKTVQFDYLYMREPGSYFVSYMDGNQIIHRDFSEDLMNDIKYTIVCDVDTDKSNYATIEELKCPFPSASNIVTFHIHYPEDIITAGWNHGKFGKGMLEQVK